MLKQSFGESGLISPIHVKFKFATTTVEFMFICGYT